MDHWSRRHPWWFGLVSALLVTTPAVAIAVWKDWPLGGVLVSLLPIFLLWFVGRAIQMRRHAQTDP
jgi:hypothetical protein